MPYSIKMSCLTAECARRRVVLLVWGHDLPSDEDQQLISSGETAVYNLQSACVLHNYVSRSFDFGLPSPFRQMAQNAS